jgi:hypothetical protein
MLPQGRALFSHSAGTVPPMFSLRIVAADLSAPPAIF